MAAIIGLMFSAPFSWACWAMRAPTAAIDWAVKSALLSFTQAIEASRPTFRDWNFGAT